MKRGLKMLARSEKSVSQAGFPTNDPHRAVTSFLIEAKDGVIKDTINDVVVTSGYNLTPPNIVDGGLFGEKRLDFTGTPIKNLHLPHVSSYIGAGENYTFDTWIQTYSSANALRYIVADASLLQFVIYISAAGKVGGITSSGWASMYDAIGFYGQMAHLAVVRTGNLIKTYVNGVFINVAGNGSNGPSAGNPSVGMELGTKKYNDGTNSVNSWLYRPRFTRTARWTANFDPMTIAY